MEEFEHEMRHITSSCTLAKCSAEDLTGSPLTEPREKKGALASCFAIETHLIKFKAFFFFFSAAIGCVFPYFSIYFKQLGFSPNQIGIISGVRPLIGFCSGPVWGSLADRFRCRRIMLCISALGWLTFITSIGFVEPASYSDEECRFVRDFLKLNSNISGSVKDKLSKTAEGRRFENAHFLREDVTAEEILLESRDWMFDSAGLQRAFVTIIILVILGELVQSPTGALADAGCVEALGDDIHKYGHQRAFGSLGMCIFSLAVGAAVSMTRVHTSQCGIPVTISNYTVAFFFFLGAMFCCFLTTLFFRYKEQADADSKPKPNPLKVFRMFLTVHFGSWLWCMFFTGVCNGAIWGFLFWHLENIGASQFLLGVANSVVLMSEIMMFLVVFRILEKTGCLLFMVLGLAGYAARFVVFAVIDNPWLVLPVEVLQGFTFAGIWSVYTKYLCANVPTEYLGTLQGFLHGVYWGLGSGSGHMIAGISVEYFGARLTFWFFAAASLVNMVVFVVIQKCTTKPDVFGNYEELKDGPAKKENSS